MLQVPLVPSVLTHLFLGFFLTTAARQVPVALQRLFLMQALAVPSGLKPQAFPAWMYLHLLLQHSEAVTEESHCSLGSLAPFPQREVAVCD